LLEDVPSRRTGTRQHRRKIRRPVRAWNYRGFGHSDWRDAKKFAYVFDHYGDIMNHFTKALGLQRHTLYMQDCGDPVGFRLPLAHPERVEALIVQNAVAHNEGLACFGNRGEPFGAIRFPAKVPFAPIFCSGRRRERAMPATIPTSWPGSLDR
jgi:pimeloyl-ACP methyl ester carboxylesterase